MHLEYFNYQEKNFYVDISIPLLQNSYPNTNYRKIAETMFSVELTDMKEKGKEKVTSFLEEYVNYYFLLAHGSFREGIWNIETLDHNYFQSLESLLWCRYGELGFDAAIVKTCNPTGLNIVSSPIPILYPLTYIGLNIEYSTSDLEVMNLTSSDSYLKEDFLASDIQKIL